MENLNDILNSEEFKAMFDFEAEKKEIESAGWNYKELENFGKQLAKQIKKSK
jgi:tRNA U34 5-methylaminomethyl-2-thiouridine-forming methyltransferase MnmC